MFINKKVLLKSNPMKNEFNKELSFNLKATNIYEFLKESYEEFKVDDLNMKKALICAMLSYHLIEWWIWEKDPNRDKDVNTKDCDIYINNLDDDELKTSFYIIKDVGNGLKHKILSRHFKVKKSDLHTGVFENTFSNEFDTSHLFVEMDDSYYYFYRELDKVIKHWDNVYNHTKE